MMTVKTRPTPRLIVKKVFAQRSPSWSTISDEEYVRISPKTCFLL